MLRRSRASAISALFLTLAGCSSWHTIESESPAAYIARAKPSRVRLSVAESTLVMGHPAVSGDSIVGTLSASRPREKVAVPASDIGKLEGPSSGPGLLGFVLVTGAATVLYFLSHFRGGY